MPLILCMSTGNLPSLIHAVFSVSNQNFCIPFPVKFGQFVRFFSNILPVIHEPLSSSVITVFLWHVEEF